MKIHYKDHMCFVPASGDVMETITVSTDINAVTCAHCVYYFFHPQARQLELDYRMRHPE